MVVMVVVERGSFFSFFLYKPLWLSREPEERGTKTGSIPFRSLNSSLTLSSVVLCSPCCVAAEDLCFCSIFLLITRKGTFCILTSLRQSRTRVPRCFFQMRFCILSSRSFHINIKGTEWKREREQSSSERHFVVEEVHCQPAPEI